MAEPATDPPAGAGAERPERRRRLGAGAVADRLGRLDEALGALERTPGATAGTAMTAVSLLTEVYGEALARVMDHVADHHVADHRLAERLMDDELIGHLLILHGIHPETAEQRIARALAALRRQGAGAELAGVDGATARVRLAGGCGCGAGRAREAVREAVLAAAPETAEVEFVEAPPAGRAAFVPVESLMRRPVPAGDGTP